MACSLPALTVWKSTERVLHRQHDGVQSPCPHSVKKHRTRSPQAGHRRAVFLPSQCEKAQNAFSTGRASAGSPGTTSAGHRVLTVVQSGLHGMPSTHWAHGNCWIGRRRKKRNTADAGRWVSLHNIGKSVRGFNTSYCKLTDSLNLLGKGEGGEGGAAVNPKGTCLFYCYFCPFITVIRRTRDRR